MPEVSAFRNEATYSQTRLPVELASTLLPAAYHDVHFFSEEREALWSTSWVCVGLVSHVSDVGETIVREVAGTSILVTRDKDHELRAFHNVCRHRGSQLVTCDQVVKAKRFRCP